jgi:hypothetical protein
LKTNNIPRGIIPLEKLFDHNDVKINPTLHPLEEEVEEVNLNTLENPRLIKNSKSLTSKQKKRYIALLKLFFDVFTWSYHDLKTYYTYIIEHKIPLKGVKPFRKKLKQVNPLILPMVEKEIKKLLDSKIIIPLRYSK